MTSISVGPLEQCLRRKLQAQRDNADHRKYKVFDDAGTLVAITRLSHGWRSSDQISDQMVNAIKSQLNLQRAVQLVDLIDCTLTRAGYLQIAAGSSGVGAPGP